MASDRILLPNDEFIVGRKTTNKTYKHPFSELQHDIGLSQNTSPPTDPIDGHIWVHTGMCPPQIFIYSECDPSNPDHPWYPIVPPTTTEYLQKDINGNVYITGNLYIKRDIFTNRIAAQNGTTKIELDPRGNVFITDGTAPDVFVSGDIYHGVATDKFVPYDDQPLEDNGAMIVTGHLVVAGDIIDKYDSPLPF